MGYLIYIILYFGPSPPSGTSQRIIWLGHLMRQVWQCRQLDGLSMRFPSSNL